MPLPLLSSLVPPPLQVVLWIHLLIYAWGSMPLWINRWFWINGLCCPRIATLCCFYLAVCSCLCICYEWIYSGVKQPLRLPLTIPLPMPIFISSSCRSRASSCFSRAGWFRRFCWWSSQWRKTFESVEEANALALGKHTHLLRIRETWPTFINHLVGISLLKVGQKSKPRLLVGLFI